MANILPSTGLLERHPQTTYGPSCNGPPLPGSLLVSQHWQTPSTTPHPTGTQFFQYYLLAPYYLFVLASLPATWCQCPLPPRQAPVASSQQSLGSPRCHWEGTGVQGSGHWRLFKLKNNIFIPKHTKCCNLESLFLWLGHPKFRPITPYFWRGVFLSRLQTSGLASAL